MAFQLFIEYLKLNFDCKLVTIVKGNQKAPF